jgi:hypothetical protein
VINNAEEGLVKNIKLEFKKEKRKVFRVQNSNYSKA